MLLKFKEIHKSIKNFSDIEIDNFSILTGKNGSGKTQLLEAIKNGNVQVVGIKLNEIQYFNSASFLIPNEQTISIQNIKQEKMALWQHFITVLKNKESPNNMFKRIKASIIPKQIQNLQKISVEKNKPMLLLELKDLGDDHDIFQELEKYRQQIERIEIPEKCDIRILDLAFNYNGFIDEITLEEFMEKINVNPSGQNFFAQQLSRVFINFNLLCTLEYSKLLKQNEHNEIIPKSYKEKAVKTVLKKYGGKYPWDHINDLFESFEDFKYKISKPAEFELTDLDDTKSQPFTAVLQNEKTNAAVNFNELSSGEKTLLTTTLMLFNTVLTKHSPKLVLLDEIDSTLHPSMTKDLLLSLQNIFVNNGVNVILVTHSPSTVAFAEKDVIYLVDNTSKEFINKADPHIALQTLTQGFMTLKDSHVIFDAINNYELTIFSEGNNVDYIQTAFDLHHKDKSTQVNVWKGIEGKSSFGQLEMLYYLFESLNLKKKILFVFDPEVSLKVHTNEEKLIFVTKLESVVNKFDVTGIESVLPDIAFNGFSTNTTDELTGITKYRLQEKNKQALCKKLTLDRNPDIFKNFKPLTDFIIKILDISNN